MAAEAASLRANGDESFTDSASSDGSSALSGNFLLYAPTKASRTLSTDWSSHLAGSVIASLWWSAAGTAGAS